MAQPQLYSKVDIFVNGTKVLQNTDVKMTRESGLKPLAALGANDFVGAKQGAKHMTIEFSSHIPFDSFEYMNVGADQSQGNFVQLTLVAGSKSLTSLGVILNDDVSDAVEGEAKHGVRFHGQWADWQSI